MQALRSVGVEKLTFLVGGTFFCVQTVLSWSIVSYQFVAYIYDTRRFNARTVVEHWAETEPSFASEHLVRIAVSPRVEALFYMPGDFGNKSRAFFVASEPFLLDGYAEAPAAALRARGELDFQYAVWLASDALNYDISMLFAGSDFAGRAIIESQGERIVKRGDVVEEYERALLDFTPRKLGLVDEKTGLFSEEAFERIVAEREEPFRPDLLIHDEIGVPRGKVIDALHHATMGQGEVVWPPGGLEATSNLMPGGSVPNKPSVVSSPIWAWMTGQEPATMPTSSGLKRKRKQHA